MALAPFNQEVARRLVVLDQSKADGATLLYAFAPAMAGQPDRVNITAKKGRTEVTFAFGIEVADRVAAIAELFEDQEAADAIRVETAKAGE